MFSHILIVNYLKRISRLRPMDECLVGGSETPRAVNPPPRHLQIIDREGIIDDVIMHET